MTTDSLRRQSLHGADYVAAYEVKTPDRIARLLQFVDLQPDFSVADFGCGNAILLRLIHDKVSEYVGVDFSPEFIAAAKHRATPNARFVCGSIQDFAAQHRSQFDACFALDVSEHVPDDEWQNIVNAMRFCLKPGGTAYLHTPNLNFFVERLKSGGIIKQFPEHIAVRTPDDNARFFHKAGFQYVRTKLIPHYNVLKGVHPLSRMPMIGHWFAARIFITAS